MSKKKQISAKERAALNAEVAKDIPAFMDRLFGSGKWQYDEVEKLYIARDPKYSGPGFGFIAVRPDGTYFTGVRPLDVLQ
ncbi:MULTISPECIES: hypothetical protein [Burkholderia cepacia complex]|uniref:Uncharacterized protein n=1 Tax=Burkholderia contaminans TaxID=488447 RepID=A0A2S5DMA5_9BURK|nr:MULTISPECIES: hypothetical protein [Burkholderia cepacia complex]KVR89505.1 hypothetical protein WK28_24145 [Burkholderia vietnamiensis]MBR7920240.1 hypothetical protein [Burkholderia vietnamiensis]MBR8205328.1 hypothetical protein [Burkholderia vietnamiensis]POZ80227.1 hypothetical protein C3743_40340 [Burkholderia contaminans]HDR9133250.1 hypothetical protein [Burkholderia vietnamiensis]